MGNVCDGVDSDLLFSMIGIIAIATSAATDMFFVSGIAYEDYLRDSYQFLFCHNSCSSSRKMQTVHVPALCLAVLSSFILRCS